MITHLPYSNNLYFPLFCNIRKFQQWPLSLAIENKFQHINKRHEGQTHNVPSWENMIISIVLLIKKHKRKHKSPLPRCYNLYVLAKKAHVLETTSSSWHNVPCQNNTKWERESSLPRCHNLLSLHACWKNTTQARNYLGFK
jgi:hypothetical protein